MNCNKLKAWWKSQTTLGGIQGDSHPDSWKEQRADEDEDENVVPQDPGYAIVFEKSELEALATELADNEMSYTPLGFAKLKIEQALANAKA